MTTARERLRLAIERAMTRRPAERRDVRAVVVRQGDLEQVLLDCPEPLDLDADAPTSDRSTP